MTIKIYEIAKSKKELASLAVCGIIGGTVGAIIGASKKADYNPINSVKNFARLDKIDKKLPGRFGSAISGSLAVAAICTFVLLLSAVIGELVVRGIEAFTKKPVLAQIPLEQQSTRVMCD
ncbi:hypothetical protein [Lyticum sinuosum]|uniref:Uncharacterized protein n=1 Tax=Lyticum sinuosum TaxID=1332059 RepID=A0AAE5AHV9_9RICK|nr:hypothetical protein [Lyticum sinuosum]MDZ5761461.1 hypothetical protein [Lyticum sinuosum]